MTLAKQGADKAMNDAKGQIKALMDALAVAKLERDQLELTYVDVTQELMVTKGLLEEAEKEVKKEKEDMGGLAKTALQNILQSSPEDTKPIGEIPRLLELKDKKGKPVGTILVTGKGAAFGWAGFRRPIEVELTTPVIRYTRGFGGVDCISDWDVHSQVTVSDVLSMSLMAYEWYDSNK